VGDVMQDLGPDTDGKLQAVFLHKVSFAIANSFRRPNAHSRPQEVDRQLGCSRQGHCEFVLQLERPSSRWPSICQSTFVGCAIWFQHVRLICSSAR
jgi:hypothetical protein